MPFRPFHITPANIAYSVLGGFTVVFGMFSLLIRSKLYIGEAIWAFLFGIAMGPYGANIFSPRDWGSNPSVTHAITLEVTRVVLAVGVFAIGVELPSKYMKKHVRSLLFLLGPIMAGGWVICAGLIYALIPALEFVPSLAIAACLTPTDPILAAAVVGGKYAEKHVPEHLRHLLSAESGCNDGAAFPFLFIAIYVLLESDDRVAVAKWFYITWVYEIILGIAIGTFIGWAFRRVMKFCEEHDLIDRKSYVAQYIALALLSNGITALLGSDDLLAAFCAGTAFAWDSHFNQQTHDSVFSSVIDLLFNVAVFIYIGAWMPFNEFNHNSMSVWRLTVLAICVLVLRRLPIMMALYKWIPDVRTFREGLFAGHFGPIGVGAVFIATLAIEKLPHPHDPPANQTDLVSVTIEPIIAFMVMCSILIHGLSIPFFSLGRRVHSITISRTFSTRQQQGPDWVSQIRKVGRPEDIVVNRDEATPITEKDLEEGRILLSAQLSNTKEGRAAEKIFDESCEGDELVRKWREGRHLVIEHHTNKPGVDVKVEVIRNAFEGDSLVNLDGVRHTFHAAEDVIKDEVTKYLAALSPRVSMDRSDRSAPTTPPIATQTHESSLQVPSSSSTPSREAPRRTVTPDDGEDEWVDEPSGSGSSGDKSSSKKLAPSGKPKKRRESFRRNIMGRFTGLSKDKEKHSGTITPIEGQASASRQTMSASSSLRRRTRGDETPRTRDSSPTRAIRFVEPGSTAEGTSSSDVSAASPEVSTTTNK